MQGKRIGYIRVSTAEQNNTRQLNGISVDKTFVDYKSGKDKNRPELAKMLEFIRQGDTLIVHSMDRLARNLDDLRSMVNALVKKGVRVEFITEKLVFNGESSTVAVLMLSIMGAFAEFERAIIKERQREGIEIAKRKGVYKGRKPVLTAKQLIEIKCKEKQGMSKTKLAKIYNVSRGTIYKYLLK